MDDDVPTSGQPIRNKDIVILDVDDDDINVSAQRPSPDPGSTIVLGEPPQNSREGSEPPPGANDEEAMSLPSPDYDPSSELSREEESPVYMPHSWSSNDDHQSATDVAQGSTDQQFDQDFSPEYRPTEDGDRDDGRLATLPNNKQGRPLTTEDSSENCRSQGALLTTSNK